MMKRTNTEAHGSVREQGDEAHYADPPVASHEYTVISLRPPWAWAVMQSGKDIENRSWPTNRRGRILIHASNHKAPAGEDERIRAEICAASGLPESALPRAFDRSAILGSVEIVDCVENARSKWAVRDHFHWKLHGPRPFASPVSGINGRLQFWRWTASGEVALQTVSAVTANRDASSGPVAAKGREAPDTKLAFDLDSLTPEQVLSALRKVASAEPANEVDVLRAASRELGCPRLGSRVQKELKGHVRTAIRRGVLVRDGKSLRLGYPSLEDYDVDVLVAAMVALTRKGQAMSRKQLAADVARHLGFADGDQRAVFGARSGRCGLGGALPHRQRGRDSTCDIASSRDARVDILRIDR